MKMAPQNEISANDMEKADIRQVSFSEDEKPDAAPSKQVDHSTGATARLSDSKEDEAFKLLGSNGDVTFVTAQDDARLLRMIDWK